MLSDALFSHWPLGGDSNMKDHITRDPVNKIMVWDVLGLRGHNSK